jgi:hyperosmotically inducible periplasmic protein
VKEWPHQVQQREATLITREWRFAAISESCGHHGGNQRMLSTNRYSLSGSLVLSLAGALLFVTPALTAKASASPAQDDNKIASEIQNKLKGKQFQDVKVTVSNDGVATLSGTVGLYAFKEDADKKAHKAKGVKAVENDIQVAGGEVSDQQLQQKLQQAVNYARVGYGTTAFNTVGVSVQNGDVTLSGNVHDYMDRNAILSLVSTTKGVKEVTDNIEVDPASIMDDQTRVAVARAVYGDPQLNKYAINPEKPIRIQVKNGNVELYGTVDSSTDKNLAYLRANSVPGVFSVKNNIQVAGASQPAEKPR